MNFNSIITDMSEDIKSEEVIVHSFTALPDEEFEIKYFDEDIKIEVVEDADIKEGFYLSNEAIQEADQHGNDSENHSASETECYICHQVLSSEAYRDLHVERVHGSNPPTFECDLCGVKVTRRANLVTHVLTVHASIQTLQCEFCKMSFGRRTSLVRHINDQHGSNSRRFKCDLCGKDFKQKYQLEVHVRTVHDKVKQFKCNDCPKAFGQKGQLKNHVQAVHQNLRPFSCKHCQLKFATKEHVNAHVARIHSEEKMTRRFQCPVCDKMFKTKQESLSHVSRVHKDVRKYRCSEPGCQKSFDYVSQLRNHCSMKHKAGENKPSHEENEDNDSTASSSDSTASNTGSTASTIADRTTSKPVVIPLLKKRSQLSHSDASAEPTAINTVLKSEPIVTGSAAGELLTQPAIDFEGMCLEVFGFEVKVEQQDSDDSSGSKDAPTKPGVKVENLSPQFFI